MTLVDKLDGVHVGDLILLNGENTSLVGYVMNYSAEKVHLSNHATRETNGDVRDFSFLQGWVGEKRYTAKLKQFDDYKVLQKYETPKSE